jgi:adenine-specific DNA-methyltransferase
MKLSTGDHEIWHGDALSILQSEVAANSVDLIFADPPYNIGKTFGDFTDRWASDADYAHWSYQWIDLCCEKLSPTGSFYLMTSTQAMPYLDLYVRQKLHVIARLVWHYDSSGVQARKRFGSMYEPILQCVVNPNDYTFNSEQIAVPAKTGAERRLIAYRKAEPAPYNTTKVPGNVWYFPRVRYRMPEYEDHPSQKPEALLHRILTASSLEGDIILDPFAGTFTTAVVAQSLARRSISIERNLSYCKIGLRRLSLAKTFEGEPLTGIRKSYRRKNGKTPPSTVSLFEEP